MQLQAAGVGSYFRPRDVSPLGVSFRDIQRLVLAGEAEQASKGLYRLTAPEPTELDTLAMVTTAIPNAIFCLLTALAVHQIGTETPRFVWIALDHKARKPRALSELVRLVRFSGPMLTYGVQTIEAQGVSMRITSPARTVVDCFRYRNKIGIDVAMEALQSAFRTHSATMGQIIRAAEVCRVSTVIKPYLQALSV
jgi:predicted transcriptional regulator of viral defense system